MIFIFAEIWYLLNSGENDIKSYLCQLLLLVLLKLFVIIILDCIG